MSSTASSVKKDLVAMVFGNENRDLEESLQMFVNSKLRKGLSDNKIVYRHGITRYPEVNHFTGGVAMYNNMEVLKQASSEKIIESVRERYGSFDGPLGLYHGPPSLIIKPSGSGISPPFTYWFQDLSEGIKYTAVVSLTEHSSDSTHGELELLEGSEYYFDFLNRWYHFSDHCKVKDILYLEPKWFSLEESNKIIGQYTMLYNYYERSIQPPKDVVISTRVRDFFLKHKLEVPVKHLKLSWIPVVTKIGEPVIFSSKQILRTQSSRDDNTRVYIQIPLEPKPKDWDQSIDRKILQKSYESGRFGNWIKPGLRLYLRENSTESNWRDNHETKEEKEAREEFLRSHSELLGI
jgi:hypothetical protein